MKHLMKLGFALVLLLGLCGGASAQDWGHRAADRHWVDRGHPVYAYRNWGYAPYRGGWGAYRPYNYGYSYYPYGNYGYSYNPGGWGGYYPRGARSYRYYPGYHYDYRAHVWRR